MRMTRVASNCGQHTTLAKYGAKTVKQSTAVMLIMVSMASKLSVQTPEIIEKKIVLKTRTIFNKVNDGN